MNGRGGAPRLLVGWGLLLCALGCSGHDASAGATSGGAASGGGSGASSGGAAAGAGSGGTNAGSAGCASTGAFRSETMYPGVDCSTCHSFRVTGTVYPRADVPNYCDGTPAVSIEVTGADGEVVTLTSNRVGNFESDRPLSAPYTVVLQSANGTRKPTHATNGNCNGCHTSATDGNGPGRIVAP